MRRPATRAKPAPTKAPAPARARPLWTGWLIGALLALGTMALYWPVTRCDFINYDDNWNLTDNVHVLNGLTWEGITLFLINPLEPPGWSPLTMWSHMLAVEVFGLNPWGHHLINVVVHALNAALVFALLRQMTGAKWPSLWVAVFFAIHPLRVEAVAWVTQRRELLSVFFGLLGLIAYVRYTRSAVISNQLSVISDQSSRGGAANNGPPVLRSPSSVAALRRVDRTAEGGRTGEHRLLITDHRLLWYWASWFLGLLGIMSKPTLVTWPFLLLLLDYWPLGRMQNAACSMQNAAASDTPHVSRFTFHFARVTLLPLLVEKIPFFVGVGCMSLGTFVVSGFQGVFEPGARLSLGGRVGNALITYCSYLGKLFWPTDLAVIYPRPMHSPLSQVLLAAALLLGISALVLLWPRRRPYLLIGWLWYCGTLVPVSQLVTVGAQAMADRWSYSPSLGVLIVVIWGAGELMQGRGEGRRQNEECRMKNAEGTTMKEQPGAGLHPSSFILHPSLLWVAGGAAAVLCLAMTRQQLGYWKDSEALFRHTVAVTKGNYYAYNQLGSALGQKGPSEEVTRQYQEAVRIKPDYPQGRINLGLALGQEGRTEEAIAQLREGLRLDPNFLDGHYLLALALVQNGQIDEGIREFKEALRVNPDHADTHNDLGLALGQKGKLDEAILHFQTAVRLKPDHAGTHINLGVALSRKGQTDEAIRHYQEAIRLKPDDADVHYNLGAAFAKRGQADEAIRHYQEAIRLKPDRAEAHNNLGAAFYQQGRTGEAIREFQEALRLKPDYAEARKNLIVALAAQASSAPPPGAVTNR